MIYWRAYIAAALGAAILLALAVPLLDLVLTGARLRGLIPLASLWVVYAFGGILIGGRLGLWALKSFDWRRLRSHQYLGALIGLAIGAPIFDATPWPFPLLAPAILGLLGAGSGTLYWLLDRTTAYPVSPP